MPIIVKTAPNGQTIQTEINYPDDELPPVDDINPKNLRGRPLRQVIAAFIANIGTINTGLVFGFSAVVIPQLQREDSIIQIDESQASWVGECQTIFLVCFSIYSQHRTLSQFTDKISIHIQ